MARRSADFGLSAVFFENRWGRQSAGQDLGKTHMNDAARLESRRGTPRRYKRRRARQGERLRAGRQLPACPYSTAPTENIIPKPVMVRKVMPF